MGKHKYHNEFVEDLQSIEHDGQLLRILRRANGMTQSDVAETTGISTSGISQIENGNLHKVAVETRVKVITTLYELSSEEVQERTKEQVDAVRALVNENVMNTLYGDNLGPRRTPLVQLSMEERVLVGEVFRSLRKSRGLKGKEVASIAKISNSMISHIEKGSYAGSLKVYRRICAVYGVIPEVLEKHGMTHEMLLLGKEDLQKEEVNEVDEVTGQWLSSMVLLGQEAVERLLVSDEGYKSKELDKVFQMTIMMMNTGYEKEGLLLRECALLATEVAVLGSPIISKNEFMQRRLVPMEQYIRQLEEGQYWFKGYRTLLTIFRSMYTRLATLVSTPNNENRN